MVLRNVCYLCNQHTKTTALMKKQLSLTAIAAIAAAALNCSAQVMTYTVANCDSYWQLDASRTSVRLRQQPTTSSPMLMRHLGLVDGFLQSYTPFWQGDKNPDYKCTNEYESNEVAYVGQEMMPLLETQGEWSKVVYYCGTDDTGHNSIEAWVMSHFGSVTRLATGITAADVERCANPLAAVKLRNNPDVLPAFSWSVIIDEWGGPCVVFPFVVDDRWVVVGRMAIFATSTGKPGLHWNDDRNQLIMRSTASTALQQAEQAAGEIAAMPASDYRALAEACMAHAYVTVWGKNAANGMMMQLPTSYGPEPENVVGERTIDLR